MVSGILQCFPASDDNIIALVSAKAQLTVDQLTAAKKRILANQPLLIRTADCVCSLSGTDEDEVLISLSFPAMMSNEVQLKLLDALIAGVSPLIDVEVVDVSRLAQAN